MTQDRAGAPGTTVRCHRLRRSTGVGVMWSSVGRGGRRCLLASGGGVQSAHRCCLQGPEAGRQSRLWLGAWEVQAWEAALKGVQVGPWVLGALLGKRSGEQRNIEQEFAGHGTGGGQGSPGGSVRVFLEEETWAGRHTTPTPQQDSRPPGGSACDHQTRCLCRCDQLGGPHRIGSGPSAQ